MIIGGSKFDYRIVFGKKNLKLATQEKLDYFVEIFS